MDEFLCNLKGEGRMELRDIFEVEKLYQAALQNSGSNQT